MIALLASVLAASVLGSLHCAGMCGGFVCFFAGQGETRPRAHAAYHAGRLVSYVALGAAAGWAGASLDRAGAWAGLSRVSAIVAGGLMVAWGTATIVALRRGGRRFAPKAFHVPVAAVMRRVATWPAEGRALALGLVTTLLPCGWLWAFVATAAGTGAPLLGALVMASFWIGTVPVLAGLGFAMQRAWAPLRARVPALSAAVLVVLGLLTLTGKFRVAGAHPAGGAAPACHTAAAPPGGSHGGR